jgi:hypothetical protein
LFKKIAPDKWKHFFVGIAMGGLLQTAGWWLLKDYLPWATIIVFAIVVFISYGFELFSKFTGIGIYDIMDAVASVIGGITGMALIWFLIAVCR